MAQVQNQLSLRFLDSLPHGFPNLFLTPHCQNTRIYITLQYNIIAQPPPCIAHTDRPVNRDDIDDACQNLTDHLQLSASAVRKEDYRDFRALLFHDVKGLPCVRQGELGILAWGEMVGPRVEKLDDLGAMGYLKKGIFCNDGGEAIQQAMQKLGCVGSAVNHGLCGEQILHASAFNSISCQCERGANKSHKCDIPGAQLDSKGIQDICDETQAMLRTERSLFDGAYVRGFTDGVGNEGSSAGMHVELQGESGEWSEYVGEEDDGISGEGTVGLQGELDCYGRGFGAVAEGMAV